MQNSNLLYLTNTDYSEAYKDLEEFCVENTNLLLYGEFGDASFPSISDLDVFICLKDEEFKDDKAKIIKFIESDENRKYLFFHDPLIIPLTLLPYLNKFHTTYNLKLSFNLNGVDIPKKDQNQINFLNIIWTTYLIGIGPSVLINKKFGVREKLLVLKNICQSISNIEQSTDELLFSEEVRLKAFENELSLKEVENIFKEKLHLLNSKFKLGKVNFKHRNKNLFRLANDKTFIKDLVNSFDTSNNEITIRLNSEIFDLFTQFYYKKSEDSLIQNYIDDSKKVYSLCKKMNIKFPFITPFGCQFHNVGVRGFLYRKLILNNFR
jgi:hypothetical protein